jgi:hypothetical protein
VFLVHLFRSCILHALGRDADARESLRVAREDLERQAESLDDAKARGSFFDNVPLRRLVVAAVGSEAPAPAWLAPAAR